MSEIFAVAFSNVPVSAAQDLLTIAAPATKKLQLLSIEIAANGQTTVGNYPIRLRTFASGFTPGSGGSAATANNLNPNGVASGSTCTRNNTTGATGGSPNTMVSSQFNPINGYYWQTPTSPDDAPKADLSGAFILSLDSAPASTINVSITMVFKEI